MAVLYSHTVSLQTFSGICLFDLWNCHAEQFYSLLKLGFKIVTGSPTVTSDRYPGLVVDFERVHTDIIQKGKRQGSIYTKISMWIARDRPIFPFSSSSSPYSKQKAEWNLLYVKLRAFHSS
jgi:hypothetical protein